MQSHSILKIASWGKWRSVVAVVSSDVSNERTAYVFQGCEISVLRKVTQCCWLRVSRRFERTYGLRVPGLWNQLSQPYPVTTLRSFETSGYTNHATKASHHNAPPHKCQPSLLCTLHHHLLTHYHSWHCGSEQLLPMLRRYASAFVCGVGTFVMLASLPQESPTQSATSFGGESTGKPTGVSTGALRLWR